MSGSIKTMALVSMLALFACEIAAPRWAIAETQEKPSVASLEYDPSKEESFIILRDRRAVLEKDEIPRTEKELNELRTKLDYRRAVEDRLKHAEETLERFKKEKVRTFDPRFLELEAESAKRQLRDVPSLEDIQKSISSKQSELDSMRKLKDRIEYRMNYLIDLERPRQSFKKSMSYAFAGLVGMVILGFFVLAWKDDQVRREVFGAEAGIQFLTLFSLVIAIILFGITQILEGKELAALLGGLSGYILGRVSPAKK